MAETPRSQMPQDPSSPSDQTLASLGGELLFGIQGEDAKRAAETVPPLLLREATGPDGQVNTVLLGKLMYRENLIDEIGNPEHSDRTSFRDQLQRVYEDISITKREAGIVEPEFTTPPLDTEQ